MDYVIRVLAYERTGQQFKQPCYLMRYDVNSHDGRGNALFTNNEEEALKFENSTEAWETWRTQSEVRPLRDDMLPNRPLTAFSIMVEKI